MWSRSGCRTWPSKSLRPLRGACTQEMSTPTDQLSSPPFWALCPCGGRKDRKWTEAGARCEAGGEPQGAGRSAREGSAPHVSPFVARPRSQFLHLVQHSFMGYFFPSIFECVSNALQILSITKNPFQSPAASSSMDPVLWHCTVGKVRSHRGAASPLSGRVFQVTFRPESSSNVAQVSAAYKVSHWPSGA